MSVRFDLTTIAPQLTDAVIYMDNSPAYAAFKEEIEEILADFNATGKLSSVPTFDEKDLTAKSEETLKNMHRAYLIWSFREEQINGADTDCCCRSLIRLFFKSQQSVIMSLNGGQDTVACESVCGVIEGFKSEISSNAEVYAAVKDFFKGYVYGYSFNYLKEAAIMKKYAEMLVYLGVMSNKIPSSVSVQQKILPKMATLLTNDRFKYLSGFVPKSLMLDIVFDRIEFASLSESETALVKQRIEEYIVSNYRTDREDDTELLGDDVTASFAYVFFGSYVNAYSLSEELYAKCTSGIRTFLDCDRDDTGDYSAAKICEIISAKCAADHNDFYTTEKAPCNDVTLGGTELCLKYPLVFRDADNYWFAPVCEELIFPVLDREIYIPAEIPSGMFPFADEVFTTNTIRAAAGIEDSTVTIRKDRQAVLEQLKRLSDDTILSEGDKKMLCLEQMLCLVSGNLSEEKYKALLWENFFETPLYNEYIQYRLRLLSESGHDSRKTMLDIVNQMG